MKTKLGSFALIKKAGYDNFKTLLKKAVIATLATESNSCEYVLLAGGKLEWKDADKLDDKPLLYLNEKTQSLVKEVKANKTLDLKSYSYGQCKILQEGTNVTVYFCPTKGKLTEAKNLKPLKKIFKAFKPKIFLQVVGDLEKVTAKAKNKEDLEVLEEQTEEPKTAPKPKVVRSLGKNLVQYHQQSQQNKQKLNGMEKTDKAYQKHLLERNKILKILKHLCNSWQEDVLPFQDQLDIEDNWRKLYEHWSAFFAKRKAAKAGDTSDQSAYEAEEQRLYGKALKDLERFYDDIEKGSTIDSSVIESDLATLEQHYAQWKQFSKQDSSLAAELTQMREILDNLQAEWKEEKPKMEAYKEAVDNLEQALKDGAEQEELQKLFDITEALANA